MIMIDEAYISFETAKLLKDKGFDEDTIGYYNSIAEIPERIKFFDSPISIYNSDGLIGCIQAPTQQMAMAWIRKIHNIHIELNWDKGNQLYSFNIWKPGKYQPEISSLDLWRIYKDDNFHGEWKYEEACEAAIQYCLKNFV